MIVPYTYNDKRQYKMSKIGKLTVDLYYILVLYSNHNKHTHIFYIQGDFFIIIQRYYDKKIVFSF